jgi:hypothetical protein
MYDGASSAKHALKYSIKSHYDLPLLDKVREPKKNQLDTTINIIHPINCTQRENNHGSSHTIGKFYRLLFSRANLLRKLINTD